MKTPEEERPPEHRFPRLVERDLLLEHVMVMRRKYPAPVYDPSYDGSSNPADWILSGLMETRTKVLRRQCRDHALRDDGPKWKLVKRMYLHWRSKKLKLGKVYYGYGPGCWNTRVPTCICGYLRRDDMERRVEENLKRRETVREQTAALAKPPIMRFPREA